MQFLSTLISGLGLGSIYALIAIGYTMVYGIAKMLNFAHGDVIMVGAYAIFVTVSSRSALAIGLPAAIAIPIAIILCSILGVIIEFLAYRPLRGKQPLAVLITAIGVSYALQSIVLIVFGSASQPFPELFTIPDISLLEGDLVIKGTTLLTLVVTAILMVILTLFINKTKMGKAMRAVSEDKGAAELMGISVNKTISVTFAIGSALAAIAGIFYGMTYVYINPYTGSMPGIKAFVAAVFGGIGSLPGAMLGGVLMGIIEAVATTYISSQLASAIEFAILIIVLLVKPTGLLGKKINEKV
ncbi:MAG: branched-chain amino acid ABC transporter permease [Clostridia bacterium]|nr:branched-chain amino acid ABC transporter permease [Clostridia bacterium]